MSNTWFVGRNLFTTREIMLFNFVLSIFVIISAHFGFVARYFLMILVMVFIVLVVVSAGMGSFTLFIIGVQLMMFGLLLLR